MSLLEFKAIEYKRKGNAIATDEQLARIVKLPKREFMRRGVNQHTLEKICSKEPVRAIKLAKCFKVLEEYELGAIKEHEGGCGVGRDSVCSYMPLIGPHFPKPESHGIEPEKSQNCVPR